MTSYNLFVIIMAVGREHEHNDFCVENAIHQAVFLYNLPAPSAFGLALQRFRVSETSRRMFLQFFDKSLRLGKCFGFAFEQTSQMLFGRLSKSHSILHIQLSLERLSNLHLAASHDTFPAYNPLHYDPTWRRISPSSSASGRPVSWRPE